MSIKLFLLFICTGLLSVAHGQTAEAYPVHWWTGMKWNKVQLLIRASDSIPEGAIKISYPGISVNRIHRLENRKYVAADITISPSAKPGNVKINVGSSSISWPLRQRRTGNGTRYAQGVRSEDFIYFLMPDRFSNGDTTNDRIAGLKDQSLNRDSIFLRHGGDLTGVINHLDYLQQLGVTALWLTPVLQNDMPNRTEHGYAITNHYKVEPRLGGEEAYRALSEELHKRGMKLIQDAVYNHMGLHNFLMQDPPAKDWVHQWPTFTKPNYKDQVHFDPYVSSYDKKKMVDGWFTQEMPDFNQSNPYVANFLIQHAIWCVEEFGVDGWRIDTYIYVDGNFMNRCNRALMEEFPKITLAGESWVNAPANQAFFTRNNYSTSFKSNLPGTIDFQALFRGIMPSLNQAPDGVNELYQTLSNDFLYKDAMSNVVFLDNHDMSRFYSVVGESVKKQKIGIQWLLTTRGIPQMYYGTEVLMKGISNPDGWVRLDFPGGWAGDAKNAFTGTGLSEEEKSVQQLTKKLANFRKKSSALGSGKLMHFVPEDGVYVYFRYDSTQSIMCIMNTANQERTINMSRFAERLKGYSSATEVTSEKTMNLGESLTISGEEMWILELKR